MKKFNILSRVLLFVEIGIVAVLVSGILCTFLFFDDVDDDSIEYVEQYGYDDIKCYYNSSNDYKLTCYNEDSNYDVIVFYISYIFVFIIVNEIRILINNKKLYSKKSLNIIKNINVMLLILGILRKDIFILLCLILLLYIYYNIKEDKKYEE